MRLLLALAALALLPGAQACSIAAVSFTSADLGDDIVVTHLNQDGVTIDLATGKQTTLTEDFFPAGRISDDGRHIVYKAQRGLGADCSGDVYVRAVGSSFEKEGIRDFDIAGGLLAVAWDDRIDVYGLGTWKRIATYQHSVPAGPFGHPGSLTIAVHPDGRVAAATNDEVVVHGTNARHGFGAVRALDWFGDDLVMAVAQDPGVTFQIARGTQYIAVDVPSDDWGETNIAAGKDLYLQYGNTVLHVDGETTRRLVVPSGHAIGSVAADDDGAVLMVLAGQAHGEPLGIQRLDGRNAGTWHMREGNDWVVDEGPAWRWTSGPVADVAEQPRDDVEDAPAPLAILPLLLAFLARRRGVVGFDHNIVEGPK